MADSNNIWTPSYSIDDSVDGQALTREAIAMGMSAGYEERESPYLQGVGARFPADWIIPEVEWKERIKEKEAKGRTNRAMNLRYGVKALDQNGTNYCWVNGVTQCIQIVTVQTGQRHVPLSPASVGGPIKRFQNVGGWGDQALDYIRQNGINAQSDWPPNAIDKRYYTQENKEKAKVNIVTEWWDIDKNNYAELISCLLHGFPVAAARMKWSHLTCDVDATISKKGQVVPVTLNSWSEGWGDKGYGLMEGSWSRIDEGVSPRVRLATQEDLVA